MIKFFFSPEFRDEVRLLYPIVEVVELLFSRKITIFIPYQEQKI